MFFNLFHGQEAYNIKNFLVNTHTSTHWMPFSCEMYSNEPKHLKGKSRRSSTTVRERKKSCEWYKFKFGNLSPFLWFIAVLLRFCILYIFLALSVARLIIFFAVLGVRRANEIWYFTCLHFSPHYHAINTTSLRIRYRRIANMLTA